MTALTSFGSNLAAAGEYSFPQLQAGSLYHVTVIWAGVGSITLGYVNANGAFASLKNSSGTAITISTDTTESYEVRVPHTGLLAAKVVHTGATVGSFNCTRCIP